MSNEKFIEIETALAHQEQQIQDLSEMMTRQWQEIERLKKQLDLAQSRIDGVENSVGESKRTSVSEEAAANKPPHY